MDLALVQELGVGGDAFALEGAANGHKFLEQAEKVRAGAARGVNGLDGIECVFDLFGVGFVDPFDGMGIHEAFDGGLRCLGLVFEVTLEGLAAHEGDHRAGRVVGAGLMASGNEFLEDLAEHFGIDGNFDLERGGFFDGEIVTVE